MDNVTITKEILKDRVELANFIVAHKCKNIALVFPPFFLAMIPIGLLSFTLSITANLLIELSTPLLKLFIK